jgi:imidazolonepropionase-like amidohydrolase
MLLIKNGRILPATGAEPFPDGNLVVEGERIAALGTGQEIKIPGGQGVHVIDAEGATVLPGLMDMHVHIVGEMTVEERIAGLTPRAITAQMMRVMGAMEVVARSGVTTLRDAGFPHHGVFSLREAIDSGLCLGPRLFLSGRALCTTGGHGERISVQADGCDAVRRAARAEMKAGAEWIKLMATGGTATPGERTLDVQFTVAEMAAAVDEAHRRGKRVCAHCSCLAGARAVIEAGVDSVEHGIVLDEKSVGDMVDEEIWLVPSLKCTAIEGKAGPGSGIPDFVRQKAREIYKTQMRSFQRALAAGVQIAAGTDAGPDYLPLGRESLVLELALMVELGMTPPEAIESCTRQAARLLGVEEDLGTLEVGKVADILVVDGDPLADISALNQVRHVVKEGQVITGKNTRREP